VSGVALLVPYFGDKVPGSIGPVGTPFPGPARGVAFRFGDSAAPLLTRFRCASSLPRILELVSQFGPKAGESCEPKGSQD
jgi:hypothetical protein